MFKNIIKIIITSLIQWFFIVLLLDIYNYCFELKRPDISLGISKYYYSFALLPVILLICNAVTLFCKNKYLKIIVYLLCCSLIIWYWYFSFTNYPYRTSFVILISIIMVAFVA